MTETKRPNRIEPWVSNLQTWLRQKTPQRVDAAAVAPDAFCEAIDAMDQIPVGDRKAYAVATCLYKLGLFQEQAPLLEQRSTDDPHCFELVNISTGAVVSDDLEATGLRELVRFPKARWVTELRISLVLRLHRAGFTYVEIAELLPNAEHQSSTDVRRDSKAIAMLLEKYRDLPRPDLAYAPVTWPLRVS